MGMATYYLKARFRSGPAARSALSKFTALVNEGAEAESWRRANNQLLRTMAFWHDFQKKFALVYEYLGPQVRADYQLTSYALNFGERDNSPPTVQGKYLYFSAYVWHFADWSWLAKFAKSKLGALGVDWISEECVDPFDLLQP